MISYDDMMEEKKNKTQCNATNAKIVIELTGNQQEVIRKRADSVLLSKPRDP